MRRPNFIIVYCDDLGYGDLGCYGSETVRTPRLDRLAAEGVRFTDWYSNSPVCSPSRASLLTGRYPNRTGINKVLDGKKGTAGLPAGEVTLASVLKTLGYRTAMFGKWHLGSVPESLPNAHGFDEFYGLLAGCSDYYSHMYYYEVARGESGFHDLWHNGREAWRNGEYATEIFTDQAVRYIESHAASIRQAQGAAGEGQPFFLYVAYNAPHFPLQAPQRYMDRFPDLPWDRRIMAAMIAAVDDGVGRIVDTLKAHGLYEDTVIFFSSDNGPSRQSRNWMDGREDLYYGSSSGIFSGAKSSLFEGGIREPAILVYPARLPEGRVCREMCAMMNIFPTFVTLAGGEVQESDRPAVDGHDIFPMLTEGAPNPLHRLFWAYGGQLAVREGNWKLVLNGKLEQGEPARDRVHLSDLSQDPGERNNLKDQYPDVVRRLTQEVEAWFKEVTGG
jgi:arylsulfatase A-like enzyme